MFVRYHQNMFNKLNMLTLILLACIIISKVSAEDAADDDEYKPVKVPECEYEYKEGMPQCPNVTSGGAIPKLMQCANKMKHDFMGFCKNPPSMELLDKVREQCLEVCILPCLPTDMMSLVGECDMDISNVEISMDMFCDKKKQKIGKVCAASMFRKHKNEYMDLFNKKIHMICKLCFNFYNCYKRIKKEMAVK